LAPVQKLGSLFDLRAIAPGPFATFSQPAGTYVHYYTYDPQRRVLARPRETQHVRVAPHSRYEVQLCAFGVLAMESEDFRSLPLSMRKTNLERLLRGRTDGIFVNPFESGAIGPELFRAACDMGLEGLVSKRSDRPYRGGRSPHWIKVKNRQHHAFERVKNSFS
jgi:ATP-dependent DNA ligase